MKRLLDDYRFDDGLCYEAHKLHYLPEDGNEMIFGGILGAAVLWALLADTDEGDARGIAVDGEAQRDELFVRYEREVRRDNGGLFHTEVATLNQAYLELVGTEDVLLQICGNDRMFDLAFGLMMDYMKRLVREEAYDHIYEAVSWRMPFAQWLFDAGYAETRRQYLLSVDWCNAEEVYTLAQELTDGSTITDNPSPTFYFEGEEAEQLMERYYRWLWADVQAQTSAMPDANVQLALIKPEVLKRETDWEFIKPELKRLEPEDLNLYRKWMKEWVEFITRKIEAPEDDTFPQPIKTPAFKQVLFADKVLPCPPENNYVEVCNYINERRKYDKEFDTYYSAQTRVQLCRQLTAIFGWFVDENALGKRQRSKKNRKK